MKLLTSKVPVIGRFNNFIVKKSNGKILNKLASYIGNIASDYKLVATETLSDIRNRPFHGGVYIALLSGLIALIRTNPTEQDYITELLNSGNDLCAVTESIRNERSNDRIQTLLQYQREGRLKCLNLLFFSVVWVDRFDSRVRLYEARCKHLKVNAFNLHEHVIDIGAVNRWWYIAEHMREYDVNPDEWNRPAVSSVVPVS